MRIVLGCLILSSLARAEDPAVQFAPLRIERGREGNALGWKVTAGLLSDGLEGRVCRLRFRLQQGDKSWEETRQRNLPVKQWAETAFYKYGFIAQTFDARRPVEVSFALIDLVDQRELGSVNATIPGEETPMLTVGDVDLTPAWRRIHDGALPAAPFADRGHKLPRHDKGYWQEYLPDPGRRNTRLIVGRGGELFYTTDGHRTFVQVR